MKKRILMSVLVAICVIMLGGCGNQKGNESVGDGQAKIETASKDSVKNKEERTDDTKVDDSKEAKIEVTMEALREHAETPASDFELSPEGDGWVLMKYLGDDEIVVLPEEIDGKKILRIPGDVFGENSPVVAIKLSNSVEEIVGTFMMNDNLKYVICGSSLKKIGLNTFEQCRALEEIELNEGLEELATNSFRFCDSMTVLRIPDSVTKMESLALGGMPDGFKVIGKAGGVVEEAVTKKGYIFEAAE